MTMETPRLSIRIFHQGTHLDMEKPRCSFRPWVLPPKLSAEPMFWGAISREIYGEAVGFYVVNPTVNIRKESDVAVIFLSSQNWALRASL